MIERPTNTDMWNVRITRDILLSDEIEELRAGVDEAARDVFGDKNAVLKKTNGGRPLAKPAHRPGYSGRAIGIQAARIYAAETFRVTQFEVRRPIREVRQRSRLIELCYDVIEQVGFTSKELEVDCLNADFRVEPGYPRLPEEIVLPVEQTGDGILLTEQTGIIYNRIRSKGFANELIQGDSVLLPSVIAIGRLPRFLGKNQGELDEYQAKKEELRSQIAAYLPLPGVELGPVKVY